MIEKQEYKGYWFIPDKSNNKVAGTLIIEPFQYAKLELIGSFELELQELMEFPSQSVIQGNVLDINYHNHDITLLDCSGSGNLNFSSDFPIMRYNCTYVFIGIHIASKEDQVFNYIQGDLMHLSEWLPAKIINQSWEVSKLNNRIRNITITASDEKIWEKSVDLDNDTTLTLFNRFAFDGKKVELGEKTLLKIESKNKSNFTELLFQLTLYKQFLSFATLQPINYKSIKLYNNDIFQQLNDGEKIIRPIIFYFIDFDYRVSKNNSRSTRLFPLFNYLDIDTKFPSIIKKWFEVKDEIAPIRQHLIQSIKPLEIFSSTDFLIIMQALEGYHRRFINDVRIDLKIRLEQLLNHFSDVRVASEIDENDIIAAKDSRHFYSHFFKEQGENVLEGIELFNLYKKLRKLLICCVLKLVGFDNENIDRLLKKNVTI